MVLNVEYILDSLHISLIILRSKLNQIPFFCEFDLILSTEYYLPLYETRAFAHVLDALFQSQNLTRPVQSVTVNFGLKMLVHIYLTLFELLEMQSTSQLWTLVVLLSTGSSKKHPLFQ